MTRKKLSRKTRTAVSVTAVFISLLLASCWGLLAFITANSVRAYDFFDGSYTEIVSFSEDYYDPRFTGVAFYAGDGEESNRLYKIADAEKTPFIFVDKDSIRTESFRKCFQKAKDYVVFCSKDRETLEALYREDKSFRYLWIVSTPAGAFLSLKMGYNCALPYEKATAKLVEAAHDKSRGLAVYDVKNAEELAACEKLRVDYIFVSDSYRD